MGKRMENLLEGPNNFGVRLERQLSPEPMVAPAAGSLLLHGSLAALLLVYGYLGGLFHHNQWGSASGGGAIQVSLVTNVLPLPSDQPPNENVLATDTPSQAPAEPTAKDKQAEDANAIDIAGKPKKPQPQSEAHVPQSPVKPEQNNKAQYGEQSGSSIARATQAQTFSSGQTAISDTDFGSRFGWYVDGINRTMGSNWYKPEVNPATPKGARVYLVFTIHRNGAPTDVKIAQPSGSPTLDRSCIRGAQRVDSFGQLPSAYAASTLNVSYYCEY